MKFVRFYILTFLIGWEVEAGGELSQEDLHFIAKRLNPLECSKLLSFLPEGRKYDEKRRKDYDDLNEDWIADNSLKQCYESLLESNERGKRGGFTKKWLVSSLYKFGRADLASRLKKRWKKMIDRKKKSRRKKKSKRTKSLRHGRKSDGGTNNKNDTNKNIVKSMHKDASTKNHATTADDKSTSHFFNNRFVIFLTAGSFLILGFLGFVLLFSYRRACRCYRKYEQYNLEVEKKRSVEKSNEENIAETVGKSHRLSKEQSTNEYTKLDLHSDKMATDDQGLSEDFPDSLNNRKSTMASLESTRENELKSCECKSRKKDSKRTISPCARIKRFIDSQKRLLRGDKDVADEKRRKRIITREDKIARRENEQKSFVMDDSEKKKRKNDCKRSKTIRKRGERSKRGRTIRANRKILEKSKPIGCTCDMCKLFNIEGEERCSERSKMIRDQKS